MNPPGRLLQRGLIPVIACLLCGSGRWSLKVEVQVADTDAYARSLMVTNPLVDPITRSGIRALQVP